MEVLKSKLKERIKNNIFGVTVERNLKNQTTYQRKKITVIALSVIQRTLDNIEEW
jgi:hypothetical protein